MPMIVSSDRQIGTRSCHDCRGISGPQLGFPLVCRRNARHERRKEMPCKPNPPSPKRSLHIGGTSASRPYNAGVVKNARRNTLLPLVLQNVQRGSTISTDEAVAYHSLSKEGPYVHESVNHKDDEYVRGIHHVNSLEGFWGHFKKGIKGTNVGVSKKHMWKYIAEYQYRYNFRDEGTSGLFNRLVLAFQQPRQEVP